VKCYFSEKSRLVMGAQPYRVLSPCIRSDVTLCFGCTAGELKGTLTKNQFQNITRDQSQLPVPSCRCWGSFPTGDVETFHISLPVSSDSSGVETFPLQALFETKSPSYSRCYSLRTLGGLECRRHWRCKNPGPEQTPFGSDVPRSHCSRISVAEGYVRPVDMPRCKCLGV